MLWSGYFATFIWILGAAVIAADDVLLSPVDGSSGPEACLILVQGAGIKPEQYTSLAKEIQSVSAKGMKLWVGIPEFLFDTAEPLVLNHGIQRALDSLADMGMNSSSPLVMAGHSLGGAMVQLWTDKNKDKVTAQVLMGSTLTRSWKQDYLFDYSVNTLTIGGELDGLMRVFRVAEAFYSQLLDPQRLDQPGMNGHTMKDPGYAVKGGFESTSSLLFPVTVLQGVTHMQFAEGDIPSLVAMRDLYPEVSYDEAHKLIASDFVNFLFVQVPGVADELVSSATEQLLQRLDETNAFIDPILQSLKLEGYHNFRPPCLCETDICEPQDNCTARSPYTATVSQPTMGGVAGDDVDEAIRGLVVNDTDSFHDVWETKPTVHLPKVLNECEDPHTCVLDTTTITQNVYHSGEDLEIWKIHIDVPGMDTGFFPITAAEIRTKMISRESVYSHSGVEASDETSFDSLDAGGVRCGEINQKSIDWAAATIANSKTLQRYEQYGQKYVIGEDVDVCPAGPCWIWKELEYNESEDKETVEVRSPQFSTPLDFYVPASAGFHYCKVLSPARVMEWMFVDGLRAKYSLQNPPAAAAEA